MQGNSKPGIESVTSEEALCPLMAPIKDSRTDWVLCSCQLSPMSVYDFLRQPNITSLAKQKTLNMNGLKREAGQHSSFFATIAKYQRTAAIIQ